MSYSLNMVDHKTLPDNLKLGGAIAIKNLKLQLGFDFNLFKARLLIVHIYSPNKKFLWLTFFGGTYHNIRQDGNKK